MIGFHFLSGVKAFVGRPCSVGSDSLASSAAVSLTLMEQTVETFVKSFRGPAKSQHRQNLILPLTIPASQTPGQFRLSGLQKQAIWVDFAFLPGRSRSDARLRRSTYTSHSSIPGLRETENEEKPERHDPGSAAARLHLSQC